MTAPQAPPKTNRITVPLFKSAHGGYGSARDQGDFRYNRVYRGWDTRFPGELRVADFINQTTNTNSRAPVWGGLWLDTNERYPIFVYAVDSTLKKLQWGAISTYRALTAVATGAAIHDAGDGLQFIYVCAGVTAGLDQVAIDSTLVATANTANFQHDKLASISGALYGSSRPSGSTRWCGVQFVPFGSSPMTSANWSSVTRVGWPSTDINNISQVRGVPVALKPEGIFMYNRQLDQWENMMPAWEFDPHPDNGRAAVALGTNLVIGMGKGGAVIFDGYSVRDISPYLSGLPDSDTTSQVFSCLGSASGYLLAVTAVSRSYIGGSGSKERHGLAGFGTYNQKIMRLSSVLGSFWKTVNNEAGFTDYSTLAFGSNLSNGATLDALDTAANGDYFYIGADRPWNIALLEFDIGATQVNTNAATLAAQYWDGSAWQTMAITDFTDLSGATLGQSGAIILTTAPTDWGARTLGIDTLSRYYIRFNVSAVLSATVRPVDVGLAVWRPSIDSTDHLRDGVDRSGGYAHILVGQPTADGITWHDLGVGTNAGPEEFGLVALAPVGGALTNVAEQPYRIAAIGRNSFITMGLNDREVWLGLQPSGLYEAGWIEPADGALVRLREIHVDGRDFGGIGNLSLYYRYSETERWTKLSLGQRPPFVSKKISSSEAGTRFQWALGFTSSSSILTPVKRPVITDVQGFFEVLPDTPPNKVTQRAPATPPRG